MFTLRRISFVCCLAFGLTGSWNPARGQSPEVRVNVSSALSLSSLSRKIESNLSHMLTRINVAYLGKAELVDPIPGIMDDKASNDLRQLWQSSPMYCLDKSFRRDLITKLNGEYQVRDIQIKIPASDLPESMAVTFTKEGVINNITFTVKEHQYLGVLSTPDKVDKVHRELILDFVENFRTAYNKKDIEFLRQVFSEDALIIVGKVIQPEAGSGQEGIKGPYLARKHVQYIKYTKTQYLSKLQEVFNKEKTISVDFSEFEVLRHLRNPDFYGVTLRQVWRSSYSDEGILFLLIQFRIDDNPLIWVRTWQDASETLEEEVFGLHNFVID